MTGQFRCPHRDGRSRDARKLILVVLVMVLTGAAASTPAAAGAAVAQKNGRITFARVDPALGD